MLKRERENPHPRFSFFLFFRCFSFFFSISDCTTRIVVTREKERSNGSSRVNVCLRLERPYNGDTCQNNWHTGVSNLPMEETSTSKRIVELRHDVPVRSINEFPSAGDESSNRGTIKDAYLHSTNVPFINGELPFATLLPLFRSRAFSKNNFCLLAYV